MGFLVVAFSGSWVFLGSNSTCAIVKVCNWHCVFHSYFTAAVRDSIKRFSTDFPLSPDCITILHSLCLCFQISQRTEKNKRHNYKPLFCTYRTLNKSDRKHFWCYTLKNENHSTLMNSASQHRQFWYVKRLFGLFIFY